MNEDIQTWEPSTGFDYSSVEDPVGELMEAGAKVKLTKEQAQWILEQGLVRAQSSPMVGVEALCLWIAGSRVNEDCRTRIHSLATRAAIASRHFAPANRSIESDAAARRLIGVGRANYWRLKRNMLEELAGVKPLDSQRKKKKKLRVLNQVMESMWNKQTTGDT